MIEIETLKELAAKLNFTMTEDEYNTLLVCLLVYLKSNYKEICDIMHIDDFVNISGVDDALKDAFSDVSIEDLSQIVLTGTNENIDKALEKTPEKRISIKEFLKEVKTDEDLYQELKEFIVEECIKDDVTVKAFLNKVDGIFKD